MTIYAHTPAVVGGAWHGLFEHSLSVQEIAARKAEEFDGEKFAAAAGLLHDFGKFHQEFNAGLLAAGAARARGEKPAGRLIEHSTAGAIAAKDACGERVVDGLILAFCIAGHHAGLADFPAREAGNASLELRLGQRRLHDAAVRACPYPEVLAIGPLGRRKEDTSFFVRMVFSALVDADRLDTEAHCNPAQAAERRAQVARWQGVIPALAATLARWIGSTFPGTAPSPLDSLRLGLLETCRAAAGKAPGLFSLTAPTGLGKTLAGLTFALDHASAWRLRRVIFVAPYISITEQVCDVARRALGTGNVLEHHSLAGGDGEDEEPASGQAVNRRLAAENWEAPVIVTTAVQLFESLHAAGAGRCRKLHNIAGSVIFLDEAQLIPTGYLLPILRCLTTLMQDYKVSVVLSTATQPSLDPRPGFAGLRGPERKGAASTRYEIAGDVAALFAHPDVQRYRVSVPRLDQVPQDWEAIANEIATHSVVLAIVNTRASARELLSMLPVGTLHLSASMCPQHRSEVIDAIKARLEKPVPGMVLRVVSTQLVEAGVDLDFPVVYRAMAGLDSLAQAAGRCNRNGLLAFGRFVVFVPPRERLPADLETPKARAAVVLRAHQGKTVASEVVFSQAAFRAYFDALYITKGENLDSRRIAELLPGPAMKMRSLRFRTAEREFRMVEDQHVGILVPWHVRGCAVVRALRDALADPDGTGGDLRRIMCEAQRFVVGVSRMEHAALVAAGLVDEVGGVAVLNDPKCYGVILGLAPCRNAETGYTKECG